MIIYRHCPNCGKKMIRAGNINGIFFPDGSWEEIHCCNYCKVYLTVKNHPALFKRFKEIIKNYQKLNDDIL